MILNYQCHVQGQLSIQPVDMLREYPSRILCIIKRRTTAFGNIIITQQRSQNTDCIVGLPVNAVKQEVVTYA